MASIPQNLRIADEIQSLLAGLRWRIRAYVWLEGLSLAVIWLGLTFWAALALDYLPILVGASEMPRAARGVVLAVIAGVLAFILYRWIFRRTFVPLNDESMAILLERRFRQFHDSLVTTVELAHHPERPADFNLAMLSHTSHEALTHLGDVRLRRVFNFTPLAANLTTAAGLFGSIVLFFAVNASAFELAASRIWFLGTEPWPRSAHIEVVGIEVQRATTASGTPVAGSLMQFENGQVKVAKGANVNLKVRALADAKHVPEYCTIYYRTAEGDRGRAQMRKVGGIKTEDVGGDRVGYRQFAFDGKPFKGILSGIRFDVVGYDHRLSGYQIEVVDSPAIIETKLDCSFPDYMVDEQTSSWLPRTIDYLPTGTQLPRGTKLTLRARTNKDLERVQILNPETGETTTLEITGRGDAARGFAFPVENLAKNLTLEIVLLDTDHVASDKPQRIFISAIPDEAPRLNIVLKGISTVVTPDVLLPARGTATDDYGIAKSWFDLHVGDRDPFKRDFVIGRGGAVAAELDFRELRGEPGGLELKPKDKLMLRLMAEDKCSLEGGPNVGNSDQYQLDVVTPDELLSLLEARELSLRRRFEQTIEEVTQTRDSLIRAKLDARGGEAPGADPADKLKKEPQADDAPKADAPKADAAKSDAPDADKPGEEKPDAQAAADRARSLQLLRVQRAQQQSQKSAQEVLGVSVSFADIREELINNRVDTEDRKARLKEQIADPLREIAEEGFPELDRRLTALEKKLDVAGENVAAAEAAVQQADQVLVQLNDVLQKMIDLETYNELLDIVRGLIKEQDDLIDHTKKQKKKQLLDLTK